MKRRFNITGSCIPERHYMVRLDDRMKQIQEDYIEYGSYFVINRGRQYGKTTTLRALEEYLKDEYLVLSLDFQEISSKKFSDETMFSKAFADKFRHALQNTDKDYKDNLVKILSDFRADTPDVGLDDLFECLSDLCRQSLQPVVLMIDEVDSASNNQVFIDFLAQLRALYLKRDKVPTFHSVILAGVYHIKNLKLKIRKESEHQYNSPWNITEDFDAAMSFSSSQIAAMLEEYETDHQTGMDIPNIAEEIFQYTSGYPVLVSSICKYIDEKFNRAWSKKGVEAAVKKILDDSIPLFESMIRHLSEYPEMKKMFQTILFQGKPFSYNPYTKEINLACMFGYTVNNDGIVQIANRIFETQLYNYFFSEEELSNAIVNTAKKTIISTTITRTKGIC